MRNHLLALQSSIQQNPWMLAGDFNVIVGVDENSSVVDHACGLLFTWINKQVKGFVARKLARVLINDIWLSNCSSSFAGFLLLEIIEESWKGLFTGNPMSTLHKKLRLKVDLRAFNKACFGGSSSRVANRKKELAEAQMVVLNLSHYSTLIELEKNMSLKLQDLMLAEESFYRQISGVGWILEGD
ncbi:hypothetical protein DITRI_Ditri09bG0069100 [Diplodiscus trichospermus]